MFCGKCGNKNADDTMFCAYCGAKLEGTQATTSSTSAAADTNDKNRKVGIIAVGVVAVVAIGLIIGLLGGRSYKATVEKYVDATFDGDARAIFKLIPNKMIDYALEKDGYDKDDLEEFIEDANKGLQDQLDPIERYLGKGWTVSHEILNVKDVTDGDWEDLKENYKEMDIKISAAKTVEVKITVKAGETESSNSMNISVIKVGRSWYLDLERMRSIF